MQVVEAVTQGIWHRAEEHDGVVYTAYQGQDRCFDDHFPCRKESCDRRHVWNWLKLFLLYLHMSADRIRFMTFLAREGG
jgi:hypothetical protein